MKPKIKDRRKATDAEKTEPKPVPVPGLSNVRHIAGGSDHMLALTHEGNVYAWGAGKQHELGRRLGGLRAASRYDSLAPQHVALPRGRTTAIFAGHHHSFAVVAVKGGGCPRVYAWGLNNYGQTGIAQARAERVGLSTVTVVAPTRVRSLDGYSIKHIACGSHHTVACAEDGRVLVWGRCDDGQMGVDLATMPADHVVRDMRGWPRELTVPTVVPSKTTFPGCIFFCLLLSGMNG